VLACRSISHSAEQIGELELDLNGAVDVDLALTLTPDLLAPLQAVRVAAA
jgi:hypothetical protein